MTQAGHRQDTGWTQIGHRLDTDRTQAGKKLDTDRTQAGHRLDTDRTQTGHILMYAVCHVQGKLRFIYVEFRPKTDVKVIIYSKLYSEMTD